MGGVRGGMKERSWWGQGGYRLGLEEGKDP